MDHSRAGSSSILPQVLDDVDIWNNKSENSVLVVNEKLEEDEYGTRSNYRGSPRYRAIILAKTRRRRWIIVVVENLDESSKR